MDSLKLIDIFGVEFIEAVQSVKIPRKKWRKELWSRLLATAFSSKGQDAAKAKGAMNSGGYALGQITVSLSMFESLANDEDLRADFGLSPDDAARFKAARSNLRQISGAFGRAFEALGFRFVMGGHLIRLPKQ